MKKLFDKQLESNVMVHENLTMQYYDISLYFLLYFFSKRERLLMTKITSLIALELQLQQLK